MEKGTEVHYRDLKKKKNLFIYSSDAMLLRDCDAAGMKIHKNYFRCRGVVVG